MFNIYSNWFSDPYDIYVDCYTFSPSHKNTSERDYQKALRSRGQRMRATRNKRYLQLDSDKPFINNNVRLVLNSELF